jgi:large subunit ribosomal protein L22
MSGVKTNERPGTRAELRHVIVSAYKVREVLNLIRGLEVARAQDVLRYCGRGSAPMVSKLLTSAVANASHNDGLDPDELYVSACYADESRTLKRWRARARGRFTRIRKRTCHITIIVSRLPDDKLARVRARQSAEAAQRRARRVAGGRRTRQPAGETVAETEAPVIDETPVETVVDETPVVEVEPTVEAQQEDEAPVSDEEAADLSDTAETEDEAQAPRPEGEE